MSSSNSTCCWVAEEKENPVEVVLEYKLCLWKNKNSNKMGCCWLELREAADVGWKEEEKELRGSLEKEKKKLTLIGRPGSLLLEKGKGEDVAAFGRELEGEEKTLLLWKKIELLLWLRGFWK